MIACFGGWALDAMKPPHLSITLRLSIMMIGARGGGWAAGTFLPTYLKTVRGMTSVGTGSYLLVLILDAFRGFVTGAYGLASVVILRTGRRMTNWRRRQNLNCRGVNAPIDTRPARE
ncbi:MAG: hypothetical protein EXR07_01770 [Acetobacteraceae bacterium]|nr:hypothetical protein [Acetobacteraceae bacterium]